MGKGTSGPLKILLELGMVLDVDLVNLVGDGCVIGGSVANAMGKEDPRISWEKGSKAVESLGDDGFDDDQLAETSASNRSIGSEGGGKENAFPEERVAFEVAQEAADEAIPKGRAQRKFVGGLRATALEEGEARLWVFFGSKGVEKSSRVSFIASPDAVEARTKDCKFVAEWGGA